MSMYKMFNEHVQKGFNEPVKKVLMSKYKRFNEQVQI